MSRNKVVRRNARRDDNEAEIVEALQKKFGETITIERLDVCDLLIGYNGRTILLEIKSGKNKLSDSQLEFHLLWRGENYAVNNPQSAIDAVIGEFRYPNISPPFMSVYEVGYSLYDRGGWHYIIRGIKYLLGEWWYCVDGGVRGLFIQHSKELQAMLDDENIFENSEDGGSS